MKKILRIIKEVYGPVKVAVFFTFICLFLIEILGMLSPLVYGKVIDSLLTKKGLYHTLILIAITVGLALLQEIIGTIRERAEIKKLNYIIDENLSRKTTEKVFSFSIGQHINHHSGIKQSVITKGEQAISQITFMGIYEFVPLVLRTGVTLTGLFILNALMGSAALFFVVAMIVFSLVLNRHFKDDLKKAKEMEGETYKFYSELLRNTDLIKANSQEKRFVEENVSILRNYFDFEKKLWVKYINIASIRDIFPALGQASVLAIGVFLVYKGFYTPGYLVTIFSWSSRAFGQLGRFGNMHRRYMNHMANVNKYFELIDTEPDVKMIENPIRPEKFSGKIEFKNVSFKYPLGEDSKEDKDKESDKAEHERKPALSGINFSIEPGQKVAFVGQSGSGKTTLVYLLLRAYDPDGGNILIDGNNLKEIDTDMFRRSIGMVEQNVNLFDQSLRYNILLGVEDGEKITDADLDAVAKLACVDKFYDRLENGFDTIIGEKGIKLSGGERQRVGIARALVKNPSILIFDEATSNLDAENEKLIKESIEKVSEGRTTIIVAHRLSTVKDADKIIVFEKGRVVGEGKHANLLKTCEQYKNLIQKQVVTV